MSWAIENYEQLAVALGEHIGLVATALAISLVIAFPLGIWTARRPPLYVAAMAVTGVLYTVPALALFALLIPFMGLGKAPAITALVLYSLLILVRNIAIGIREVPAELIEAADGMGYGKGRRLVRIELPLALPAALVPALPLALGLVRWSRAAGTVIGGVNILRTIPSLALLVVLLPLLGTGFLPAVIALTLYGLPAILINTHTALREVDADVVEAGVRQGMTDLQVMRRIQIPPALPIIFAGLRPAAVRIVSAANLPA